MHSQPDSLDTNMSTAWPRQDDAKISPLLPSGRVCRLVELLLGSSPAAAAMDPLRKVMHLIIYDAGWDQ